MPNGIEYTKSLTTTIIITTLSVLGFCFVYSSKHFEFKLVTNISNCLQLKKLKL